ncbi:DDE-type integrase/transposase/recombinase [Streptomyces sp. T028]|uniref:DDE-type integrase/transposase/recombinase n=1 Tax=Streptomyces sp. T028 TaxID=3394379 RepID=UPI003A8A075F
MRERQSAGITRRRSRSPTKPDRAAPSAPNLTQRNFTAPMPGLKLIGDITCLPTAEGWLHLRTVIDRCTREVVGCSMADHMRTQLVEDALRMAHAGGHTAVPRIPIPTADLSTRLQLLRRTRVGNRHHRLTAPDAGRPHQGWARHRQRTKGSATPPVHSGHRTAPGTSNRPVVFTPRSPRIP